MNISVIIPVYNSSEELRRCLQALLDSSQTIEELIVVDDASMDNSPQIAQLFGAKVISLCDKPHGPAFARNRGAEAAKGDIFLFLDADVTVHTATVKLIKEAFIAEPNVAALFGSYDDAPDVAGVISNYYNLRHHWTHQHSSQEAWTFWSGCGGIRREAFLKAGGFDESYEQPSIEDIALGRKLRQLGYRIRLYPDIQVKHLKHWTFRSWIHTDIYKRAIPWTKMLLAEKQGIPADLNLDWRNRVSALGVWATLLSLISGLWNSAFWMVTLIGSAIVIACNWPMLRFFVKRQGLLFALKAGLCHCFYFLYSSTTVVLLTLVSKINFKLLKRYMQNEEILSRR